MSDLANIVRLHQKMSSDILNHRAETASKEKANHDLAIKTKNTLEEVNKGEIVSLISAIDSVASKTVCVLLLWCSEEAQLTGLRRC